jgi:hypothetical protein
MELNGFDANNVDPSESREPIPAGWYKAVITQSEEKPTKAQTGSYLQMTVEVIEGEHAGRKAFERLNLNNPNATAVEIAQRTLSSICRAVGVMTPRQSADLHDKPFMVKIKVKPAKDGYDASNDIAEYAATNAAPSAAAPSAAASSTPPWKK